MDITATKRWWDEICLSGKMTPDEAATLVHAVDDLIAEVELLRVNHPERVYLLRAEKAEAERDRYKEAYGLVKQRLSDEQTAPATMPACRNLIAEADVLVAAEAVRI